ncbi:hypothetical protein ACHAXA_009981 [Cyclostephanos tholiformis]|uniref:Uncharacterized protein n=1 Tax=Cyclostephanos tholiformis TaxID=382380 RepID=A0ABD3R5J7_9STRA
MKLPPSAFFYFCLASGGFEVNGGGHASTNSVTAFAPPSVVHQQGRRGLGRSETTSNTSLGVGIHEPSASAAADENFVRREMAFRQVLREVGQARDYLDWLVLTEGGGVGGGGVGEDVKAAARAPPTAAASDDVVELLGGGAPPPPAGESTPPPAGTVYRPSLRLDLGSTVILSGSPDLNPTLLGVLNNNFFGAESVPNFDFKLIRALVPDVSSARKRAIGREARYGGLLDKLVVEPCTSDLPSPVELEGASSWIVQVPSAVDAASILPRIASLAKDSTSLKNVVVMVVGVNDATMAGVGDGWEAMVEMSDSGNAFRCTMLAVDGMYEGSDGGGYYHLEPLFLDHPSSSSNALLTSSMLSSSSSRRLSAKLAYRLLAHSLALDCTSGKALAAYEYAPEEVESLLTPCAEGEFAMRDDTTGEEVPDVHGDVKLAGRVIQAMREAGFTPVMEMDILVGRGLAAYKEYLANPPDKENAFGSSGYGLAGSKSARDEQDEKIMAMLEEESAKRRAIEEAKAAEKRKIDIEGIAKEWATKEYTLRMLNGDIDDSLSEKDFLVSVWDQALAEGAKAYDFINSEVYELEKKRKKEALVDVEDRLFWDGMPPLMRKKREKMVERVKKQYMDLLSEEELERIILTSE